MFTGIVERTAGILEIQDYSGLRRITIESSWSDVVHGESIAINGACLTVSAKGCGRITFDVITETMNKTNLGLLKAGDGVHVERSLKIGDRLHGHFVQGHVDGTAKLIERVPSPDETRLKIEIPANLRRFFVPKGSVAIDGVSLTIASLEEKSFEVALIPTTLELTLLGKRPTGWPFNIEADVMSKTIVNWLELSQYARG